MESIEPELFVAFGAESGNVIEAVTAHVSEIAVDLFRVNEVAVVSPAGLLVEFVFFYALDIFFVVEHADQEFGERLAATNGDGQTHATELRDFAGISEVFFREEMSEPFFFTAVINDEFECAVQVVVGNDFARNDDRVTDNFFEFVAFVEFEDSLF